MQKLKLFAGSFLTALFLFPAFCQAQTISIVSGNGQLVCPSCPGAPGVYAPLVVQVNNAAGNPVANATVTWVATQQNSQPVTATSTTDASGQASYKFSGSGFFFTGYFLPATVVASALKASVTFVETSTQPISSGSGAGAPPVNVSLVPATSAPALTGLAGQTAATSLKVAVSGSFVALPNIQVRLQSPAGGPSVSCVTQAGQQPGTVLTDTTGFATCTPVFGSQIGSGSYSIYIGGNYVYFGPSVLTVNPGPPALIKTISGNNQSVNPGVLAPVPLLAQVTDLGGNPSSQVTVTWSVTAGAATLSNVVTSSLSNGDVSAQITPTAGPVQVTVALASNGAIKAVFTINVNVIATALQIVSGNNQIATEQTAFPDPLIVQVNDNNLPVLGATVNFAVTSGPATLSATSAPTNAQGQAQVTATAGAASGPVVITASINSAGTLYSQTFNLTVKPPGATITAVVNAAGFQNQFVSPCSLATIYGKGLATGLQGVAAAFIAPQTLVAGVSVQFGTAAAPILDVANVGGVESVSVQVPCEVPPGNTQMVVTVNNVASNPPFMVNVQALSPGIFQFTDSDGKMRAVLVRPDGSFASAANPAARGEIIRMFVTGLGQTTPVLFTNEFDPLVSDDNGDLAPQDLRVDARVVVGVNNAGVAVVSAKYAYGMVGVYEVAFQVPEDSGSNNSAPFAIAVRQGNNLLFGNPSLIPIQ